MFMPNVQVDLRVLICNLFRVHQKFKGFRDNLPSLFFSLVAIWPPTPQVWSPVKNFSRQTKLPLSILLLNFSRQGGDFGSN